MHGSSAVAWSGQIPERAAIATELLLLNNLLAIFIANQFVVKNVVLTILL
jgi:hypothetical protein